MDVESTKMCMNHPQKQARLYCKRCGGYLCSDCIIKKNEKYYCKVCYEKYLLTKYKKCPHCDAQIPKQSLFCLHCGTKIVDRTKIRPDKNNIPAKINEPPKQNVDEKKENFYQDTWQKIDNNVFKEDFKQREDKKFFQQESLSSEPRPWSRFFARTFDLYVFILIFGFLAGLSNSIILDLTPFVLSIIIMVNWLLFEAFMLSNWGTTPGKKLFKIHLIYKYDQKLAFLIALKRSFQVWFKAEAFGIPFINLLTMSKAHETLINEGSTKYDRDLGFEVKHEQLGAGRIIVVILLHLILFFTYGYLYSQA